MKARWINCLTPRPHKCRMGCTRGFASVSARNYHHQSYHSKIKYPCRWIMCGKVFTSVYQLRKHLKKGHPCLNAVLNSNLASGYSKVIPIKE